MPNSLFVGSFQNYDLMLTALSIQLQLKFQRNLALRIVELSELHEGSSGTVIFNKKNHISSPSAARPQLSSLFRRGFGEAVPSDHQVRRPHLGAGACCRHAL